VCYSLKRGIMHSKTSHIELYSLVSLCWAHFFHNLHFQGHPLQAVAVIPPFSPKMHAFSNLEMISILPEMSKQNTIFSSTKLTANQRYWISTWNVFIRACNCGEHSVMWQTASLLTSLFSELCKLNWPRKKLGQFLTPVTNCLRDQFGSCWMLLAARLWHCS